MKREDVDDRICEILGDETGHVDGHEEIVNFIMSLVPGSPESRHGWTPEGGRVGHTPGPWEGGIRNRNNVTAWDHDEEKYRIICRCEGPSSESNARLIAAAPDLLGWLEAIISQGEAQRKAGDNCITIGAGMADGIRKAIRKARGDE